MNLLNKLNECVKKYDGVLKFISFIVAVFAISVNIVVDRFYQGYLSYFVAAPFFSIKTNAVKDLFFGIVVTIFVFICEFLMIYAADKQFKDKKYGKAITYIIITLINFIAMLLFLIYYALIQLRGTSDIWMVAKSLFNCRDVLILVVLSVGCYLIYQIVTSSKAPSSNSIRKVILTGMIGFIVVGLCTWGWLYYIGYSIASNQANRAMYQSEVDNKCYIAVAPVEGAGYLFVEMDSEGNPNQNGVYFIESLDNKILKSYSSESCK